MTSEIFHENRGEAIRYHDYKTDEIELHYTLFMKILPQNSRKSYSVAVDCVFNGERDSSFAYDISSVRDNAETIFEKLCSGQVTPCTLLDVLENLL